MAHARYQLAKAAEFDLDAIWIYCNQEWGIRQASKYLRPLKRRIEQLARKPDQGRQREDLASGGCTVIPKVAT